MQSMIFSCKEMLKTAILQPILAVEASVFFRTFALPISQHKNGQFLGSYFTGSEDNLRASLSTSAPEKCMNNNNNNNNDVVDHRR